MLELIKFFLGKIDFLAITEVIGKHKNKKLAAQLHLILVQSYEIIEIYRVLLDELQSALKSYQRLDTQYKFALNPSRIVPLLNRQASNLDMMEKMTIDMMDELRILDNKFLEAYRSILPWKFGILFEAKNLLSQGRLSLVESAPQNFPATIDGEYRFLWFTGEAPQDDRKNIEKYLYGWSGQEKKIIDVNIHDGDVFFNELARYFERENPVRKLQDIEILTDNYRNVLQQKFSVEDLLTDIAKVRKHRY